MPEVVVKGPEEVNFGMMAKAENAGNFVTRDKTIIGSVVGG